MYKRGAREAHERRGTRTNESTDKRGVSEKLTMSKKIIQEGSKIIAEELA